VWARLRRGRGFDRRVTFRVAALVGMVLPTVAALGLRQVDISVLVSWAFALAASTFCPVLLLGIWWPRLTAAGAATGMLAGGLVASAGIIAALAVSGPEDTATLLAQPALVSVPIAFATMVGVSLAFPRSVAGIETHLAVLHAPEGLGLDPVRDAP
jgi:cation/acetate symporter